MREIKFRGLCISGKKWYYGLVAIPQVNDGAVKAGTYISNSKGMPFAYQIRPETVGQWTGCKDNLGNDIYEGDIILIEIDGSGAFQNGVTTQDKAKCVYEGDGFHLITIGDASRHTSYSVKFGGSAVNRKEVIGNIHEVKNDQP